MGTADEIANAVLPGMRRRHRGRIINLASRAGIQGIPTLSAYVTSKAALIRFSEALALEPLKMAFRFLPYILEPSAHR